MKAKQPVIDLRDPQDPTLAWLSTLLHTTDSAYPIGGFAHSGGLEGMVALDHIRTADDLRLFLHNEIAETLASVELPLLYQASLAATAGDEGVLLLLDQVGEAVRFSAEQRQASRRLGAQRLALFEKLHAPKLTVEERAWLANLSTTLPHKHLCIVAGIEAAMMRLPDEAAMIAFSHQTVMMVAQAAMKIMRIGQTSVQTMVAEMAVRYPAITGHAQMLDIEDIGTCLPMLDVAAAWHETANARMFLS